MTTWGDALYVAHGQFPRLNPSNIAARPLRRISRSPTLTEMLIGNPDATTDPRDAAAITFVLELARALHVHGTPAHRLETALYTIATKLGLRAEFFSTPTSIMVGFGQLVDQRVHLLRVEPGKPNLGHLSQLADITRGVMSGDVAPTDGLRRIRALDSQPTRWPRWLQSIAYVFVSAAVAVFLRVHIGDVVIASVLGLVTGVIALYAARTEDLRNVTEPLAAFVVTTLAFIVDVLAHTDSGYLTSLAGLVIMLPGLTFTVALTELSTRHLASGTARLSGALVIFLGLGFGLALGAKFGTFLGFSIQNLVGSHSLDWLSRASLPPWTEWVALLVAPLAFTVLLNAEARDAGSIVVACAAAYLTSRFAGASMGEELGAFLGAFVVSAGSNVLSRQFRRSSMVTVVPGLLILVPGSIGFRSVTSLLGQQVEAGVSTGFRVLIVGISLAAGLLAGTIVYSGDTRRRD